RAAERPRARSRQPFRAAPARNGGVRAMNESALVMALREWGRRMSIAVRMRDNARCTERGIERRDFAVSLIKSLEVEADQSFGLRRLPNWENVEARAKGEMG